MLMTEQYIINFDGTHISSQVNDKHTFVLNRDGRNLIEVLHPFSHPFAR